MRSKQLQEFIDNFAQRNRGTGLNRTIKSGVCVYCGGSAKEFNDEISRKEYSISGLCQECQDATFKEEK